MRRGFLECILIVTFVLLLCSVGSLPGVSEDPNAPHVMISYHWAAQKTMILVKQRLKAEGFKVWMDIDNMSEDRLYSGELFWLWMHFVSYFSLKWSFPPTAVRWSDLHLHLLPFVSCDLLDLKILSL